MYQLLTNEIIELISNDKTTLTEPACACSIQSLREAGL